MPEYAELLKPKTYLMNSIMLLMLPTTSLQKVNMRDIFCHISATFCYRQQDTHIFLICYFPDLPFPTTNLVMHGSNNETIVLCGAAVAASVYICHLSGRIVDKAFCYGASTDLSELFC